MKLYQNYSVLLSSDLRMNERTNKQLTNRLLVHVFVPILKPIVELLSLALVTLLTNDVLQGNGFVLVNP